MAKKSKRSVTRTPIKSVDARLLCPRERPTTKAVSRPPARSHGGGGQAVCRHRRQGNHYQGLVGAWVALDGGDLRRGPCDALIGDANDAFFKIVGLVHVATR